MITYHYTGASQSSLEGNALASGCVGCDGKAIYATITRIIFDQSAANAEMVLEDIDDQITMVQGQTKEVIAYLVFDGEAPRKLNIDEYTVSSGTPATVAVSGNVITAAGVTSTPVTITVSYANGAMQKTFTVLVDSAS